MPVILKPRRDGSYFIEYQSDPESSFLDFTALLADVESRYWDGRHWSCNRVDAQKIQDRLNNIATGSELKLKPYNYQRQAIAYCEQHDSGLIRLPCGAGKTIIGLGAFLARKKQDKDLRAVFVVKASLKSQWLSEVSKFTDLRANVLYTFKHVTRTYRTKLKKAVTAFEDALANNNSDAAIKYDKQVKELQAKQMQVFRDMFDTDKYDMFIVNYEVISQDESVRAMLHEVNPQFWYVDEIDGIKNPDAGKSKCLYEFNDAKYRFGATATPIRKNPLDLFGIFSFIDPQLFPNRKEFSQRYLRFYYNRISGSQNEEELAERIKPHMFTRNFDEIADQLPKQTVVQYYCEPTLAQKRMWERLSAEIDDLNEKKRALLDRFGPVACQQNAEYKKYDDGIKARQTFAQMQADSDELLMMSESQAAHRYAVKDKSPKVTLAMTLINKIVDSGEKVVVFSRFIGMLKILEREIKADPNLKDVEVDTITGSISDEQRAETVKRHNTLANHKILLLSDAGEAGLNIGNTKYMIEMDLADSAAKQTQRHGRNQRADSKHKNVFVFQLLRRFSWDEIQLKIVDKKQGYSDRILA